MRAWSALKQLFGRGGAEATVVLKRLQDAQQPIASLTLPQYTELIADVPRPTAVQRDNFVQFVSHAHSWYKHLPRALPGGAFYVFLDKFAGCDRLIMRDGTSVIADRTKRGFHYSDIPTEQYRTRFGHLAFSCGSGTTVVHIGEGPVTAARDEVAAVPGDDAQLYGLPAEILEAGLVPLTAAIHTLSAGFPWWDALEDWPQESGGRDALEKIVERCRVMRAPSFKSETMWVDQGMVDPVLHELLAPEQRRQQKEILRAIDRVCEVIGG